MKLNLNLNDSISPAFFIAQIQRNRHISFFSVFRFTLLDLLHKSRISFVGIFVFTEITWVERKL